MKRKGSRVEFMIDRRRLAKVLDDGKTIIEKIGDEHDGSQCVVRISPGRQMSPGRPVGKRYVQVTIQWYTWDHGGHMY